MYLETPKCLIIWNEGSNFLNISNSCRSHGVTDGILACIGLMTHVIIHRLLRKLVHIRMGQVKYHGLKGIKVLDY